MERLIYQYTQVYVSNDLYKALQYLCLLTLYSPKQGYTNEQMIYTAKSCICKFTMANGDFKSLLGELDNERKVVNCINQGNCTYSSFSRDLSRYKPNF